MFDILLTESITLLPAFSDEDTKVGEISEIFKLFAVFFLFHIDFLGFLSRFQPFFHVLWAYLHSSLDIVIPRYCIAYT